MRRQENVISISFFFLCLNISCLLSLDTLEAHFIWFQIDFLEVGFTWSLVPVLSPRGFGSCEILPLSKS